MRNFGFTLSEVLITLAVIGVVSAMTLPIVIQEQRDRANVAKLQKTYSVLSQALLRAKDVSGDFHEWSSYTTNPKTIYSYIKPYLSVIKECNDRTNSGCWAETTSTLSGATGRNYWQYYDGQIGDSAFIFVLKNGVAINIDVVSYTNFSKVGLPEEFGANSFIVFDVDVNGIKGPNMWGKDVFGFAISPNNDKLVPFGSGNNSANCQKNKSGMDCTFKVLQEKAINY